eukprot:329058-Pleurochrysis_carterae.AAC.1
MLLARMHSFPLCACAACVLAEGSALRSSSSDHRARADTALRTPDRSQPLQAQPALAPVHAPLTGISCIVL